MWDLSSSPGRRTHAHTDAHTDAHVCMYMYIYVLGTNARFFLLNASHFLKINIPGDSKAPIALWNIRRQFRSTTNDNTHKTKCDTISGDFA